MQAVKKDFKIFKWDSSNTGFYTAKNPMTISQARHAGKLLGGNHYTIEGQHGFFEEYEGGEKVSWSFAS